MVKAILDTFIEIKDRKHYYKYQQANTNKKMMLQAKHISCDKRKGENRRQDGR